jgi:CRP/FNR family transcriptional regulator
MNETNIGFGDLYHVPECLIGSNIISLPKGTRVFQSGDTCDQFFYVLKGVVRVDLISLSGKAIMLYRIGADQTCILNTSCLLSGNHYCAEACIEEDVEACIISHSEFEEKLNKSTEFRRLVFLSFSERLASMMSKIEEVAFVPIDTRLAARILQLQSSSNTIKITHDELASDLGTAREVISRKLAQWEKLGMIERGRGILTILNTQQLQYLASGEY